MKRYAKDMLILLVPLAIAAVAYLLLPDQIPVQWRFDGTARYADKWQVFPMALLPFVIYKLRQARKG